MSDSDGRRERNGSVLAGSILKTAWGTCVLAYMLTEKVCQARAGMLSQYNGQALLLLQLLNVTASLPCRLDPPACNLFSCKTVYKRI